VKGTIEIRMVSPLRIEKVGDFEVKNQEELDKLKELLKRVHLEE